MEPRARTLLGVPFCGGTITLAQTCNAVFAALLSLRLSMLARSGPSAKNEKSRLERPGRRAGQGAPDCECVWSAFASFCATGASRSYESTFVRAILVPEITASEHCRVCSALARTMSGRLALSDCCGVKDGTRPPHTPIPPGPVLVTE
jgi:hypothetical protein